MDCFNGAVIFRQGFMATDQMKTIFGEKDRYWEMIFSKIAYFSSSEFIKSCSGVECTVYPSGCALHVGDWPDG